MSAPKKEDLSARKVLHTLLSMGPGRLKVYLGWAPGVGKSRRALLDLATLKKRGIVPVIGWLEDKGREEIRILAGEFRSVPPREVVVAGKSFREMDVEAILRESPPIVFVDELARDNPRFPGACRAGRKWAACSSRESVSSRHSMRCMFMSWPRP